jgi:hypothetical protein
MGTESCFWMARELAASATTRFPNNTAVLNRHLRSWARKSTFEHLSKVLIFAIKMLMSTIAELPNCQGFLFAALDHCVGALYETRVGFVAVTMRLSRISTFILPALVDSWSKSFSN